MDKKILNQLAAVVGPDHLLTSPEDLSCYSYDASGRSFPPEAVALPGTAAEVAAIMALAGRERFPVVPRGAGSGMTGGSLPVRGGLVLATGRLNRILEIDPANMIAVVEPGVVTGDLQEAAAGHRLMYPPDPASLKFCTIGGNAAECAGGPSAVKYGVTRDYILGLEVVLPTGEIIHTGVRTAKGVVGYDLTRLFIGSEGTLGIFTKLILQLLPLPEAKATFLLPFPSLAAATGLVSDLLRAGHTPCTLEYMDRTTLRVVGPKLPPSIPGGTAAILIVELDGSRDEVARQQQKLRLFLEGRQVSYRLAADRQEALTLWQARRAVSPATFTLAPHKISEDVVVPRSKIPELVAFTEDLAKRLGLSILTFGHAGDGNIHVNIMLDRRDERQEAAGRIARRELFAYVVGLGGTLSGEHGIGITKSRYLPLEVEPATLAVMRRIKQLFDPCQLLNPGKIFPDDPESPA